MERYFILDKFNTFADWHLILTAKNIPDAEPKTNYVALDGMNGTLDLSEALTGEITYNDRTISATFWTDYGTRKNREKLLRDITAALHGKKVKIIEPDDPTHYFYGRIKIKSKANILPYASFTIEAICEPWRYANEESVRKVDDVFAGKDLVINNNGVKTLSPVVTISGTVRIKYDGGEAYLSDGVYKISDFKLRQGVNVVNVWGVGSATFTYREADL